VVIEDRAARPAGRVRFADAAVACTAEEAAVTARTLAGVQRRYWESPRFGTDLARFSPSGSPSMWFGTYSSALVARLPHRYDDIVDADFRADALLLHTRRDQVAALWRSLPQSLLHGDTHRGNMAFEDHGAAGPATSGLGAAGPATSGLGVTLFDWQVAGQGPAYKDLAYFAATSLEPDVRRATERDLVADYVGVVRAGGGPDITEAAAWDAYRLLVVTAYSAAAFTAVFSGRLQSDETMRAALARAVAAVRDHDSFARLRAHLT
jgi:aminoglycoside phosphotransferase (APT) family kinase protein